MVNLVLKFVSCARAAGLRISTSEVLDCLNQIELVDILDEPQFAAVLRANFAKSRREQHHFDRLYHLFFHELRQDETIAHSDALGAQIREAFEKTFPVFVILKNRFPFDSSDDNMMQTTGRIDSGFAWHY